MPLVPLTLACLTLAAAEFGFAVTDLQTVLAVEGGREGVCSPNRNGTVDCGPFQLNEVNGDDLAAFFGVPSARAAMILVRDDGCANARGAGYLLRRRITEVGHVWTGVGNYHSKTPALRVVYQERLARAFWSLRGAPGHVAAAPVARPGARRPAAAPSAVLADVE